MIRMRFTYDLDAREHISKCIGLLHMHLCNHKIKSIWKQTMTMNKDINKFGYGILVSVQWSEWMDGSVVGWMTNPQIIGIKFCLPDRNENPPKKSNGKQQLYITLVTVLLFAFTKSNKTTKCLLQNVNVRKLSPSTLQTNRNKKLHQSIAKMLVQLNNNIQNCRPNK